MLAPRSYLFTAHSKETRNDRLSMANRRSPAKRDKTAAPTTTAKPTTTKNEVQRPTTPSSPVVIPPMRGNQDANQRTQAPSRRNGRKQRAHSPDAISPSVAALLAMTQIPTKKQSKSIRQRGGAGQRLTVDAILQHADVSEKELSMSLGKSPLDYLLSPPEELHDDLAASETGYESVVSTRTVSCESMPSLEDESIGGASPSLSSLNTPSPRGKRSLPSRRMLSSPAADSTVDDHPLLIPEIDINELDYKVFQRPRPKEQENVPTGVDTPPRKSAFKSNLTASLRALRSAAKSFSSLKTPMMTPDDFLTRSIITIDPQVPFTDERMPPRLEDTPTPALRRYLNPTTNAPIGAHVPTSLAQTMSATKCTASIQMQTYSVSRSEKSSSPSVISRRSQSTEDVFAQVTGPVARQREIRENSDFLRVAVLELVMQRNGKIEKGRARWALPPREAPNVETQTERIDGVPLRWIAQVME